MSDYDYNSGCDGCDEVNVSNAVHGIVQLAMCNESEPETIDEALSFVASELEAYKDE